MTATYPVMRSAVTLSFRASGVCHHTKEGRHPWNYKAQMCLMVGHDKHSRNCHRILTVHNGRIISHKDCIFDLNLLQNTLPELIEIAETRHLFLEF